MLKILKGRLKDFIQYSPYGFSSGYGSYGHCSGDGFGYGFYGSGYGDGFGYGFYGSGFGYGFYGSGAPNLKDPETWKDAGAYLLD